MISLPTDLTPKFFTVLREGLSPRDLGRDIMAGVIVGIVALPLAIAFAIASGVKPEQGLYTAIVAGFVIALLSGSRVQIGGPTGAFVVLVFDIVSRYGVNGLTLATLMAGALLVVMGLARMGAILKYIPYPVTVGFTAGIAVIIFSGQMRDFLGLQMEQVPAEFLHKWTAYGEHLGSFNPWALTLALATVAIIQLWPRVTARVPGSLVALIACTALVHLFDLPVDTIGLRFGAIPTGLPMPQLPSIDFSQMRDLIQPAMAIALLGGIESLLSAVVADGMTERRHRSNMELVAQGIANLVTPLFGGIPATGAIARTATNIKNGGRTPIAGMVHALTLLLILLVCGRWAAMIPMPTLAGILVVVAWNMSERQHFLHLLRAPKGDVLVLMSTFSLTVLVDLTVAIQVGVVLAALLFMGRMAEATQMGSIKVGDEEENDDPDSLQLRDVPEGVEVFEINGPFFFGAADKFSTALGALRSRPRVLILRMRHVPSLDATALHALENLLCRARRDDMTLLLSGVQPQPRQAMIHAGFLDAVGRDNVFAHIDPTLRRARQLAGSG